MKKRKLLLGLLILFNLVFTKPVMAANPYCTGFKSGFKLAGEFVRALKIIAPIIIIIFVIIDLVKLITTGKDSDLTKSLKSAISRVLLGVCIFFLPSIIEFVFSLVDSWTVSYENSYRM